MIFFIAYFIFILTYIAIPAFSLNEYVTYLNLLIVEGVLMILSYVFYVVKTKLKH